MERLHLEILEQQLAFYRGELDRIAKSLTSYSILSLFANVDE